MLWPLSASAYAERRAAAAELDRLRAEAQSRAREIDLLRFGLAEIEQVGAERRVRTSRWPPRRPRLQSADDLRLAGRAALPALAGADDEAGGALSEVTAARKALEQAPSDAGWPTLGGGWPSRLRAGSTWPVSWPAI